jgi:hypothetical protein
MGLTSTRPTISTNKSEPTLNRLNHPTLLSQTRLRELPNTKPVSLSRRRCEDESYERRNKD